jgi:hypothetical protein
MIPEPFLTVYLIHRRQKPFKTVSFFIEIPHHRAEATVLMRSLRVMLLFDRSQCVVWLRPKGALCLCGEIAKKKHSPQDTEIAQRTTERSYSA